jgi:hypothetical protein
MLFDTALNTVIYQPVVEDLEFTPSIALLMVVNIGIYGYLITTLIHYVTMLRF